MASIISAGTTSATALNMSADTSGVLQLASNNGTVALTINTSQQIGMGTASPSKSLDVQTASGDCVIRSKSNGAGGAGLFVADGNGSGSYPGLQLAQSGTNYWSLDMRGDTNLHLFRESGSGYVMVDAGSLLVNATSGDGGAKLYSNNGSNGWPVTSGTTQTYGALRLRGGDNAVLDFGMNSTATWIQATDLSSLGQNYTIYLNPNGGNVIAGTRSIANQGTLNAYTNSGTPAFRAVSGPSTADGSIILMVDKYSSTSTTSQWFLGFTISNQGTASGVITANGASQAAFGSWSDRRLKENIVDLPPQLDNILKLRPVEFDYIESEGGGHQISFIAQEFEEVYPDAIGERPDGMKTLTGWSKTEARLVKAIQELNAKVTALENK